MDPRRVEAFAKEHGCKIREGKGDHKVMSYRDLSETYYTGRDLSIGVAREVWKFFLRAGFVVGCLLLAAGGWWLL